MVGGFQFKVCGLTRVEDAVAAASAGADFLGFIFHLKSPRYLPLDRYRALAGELPDLPKVAVSALPSDDALDAFLGAGFDYLQIHFPVAEIALARKWSERVGPSRLWLAPKLPPGASFPEELIPLADTFLWDAYKAEAGVFGGTGARSDWDGFRRVSAEFPNKRWILAGGLSPSVVGEAVAATGARLLDFNSGVEVSPGVKDLKLVSEVREALSALSSVRGP